MRSHRYGLLSLALAALVAAGAAHDAAAQRPAPAPAPPRDRPPATAPTAPAQTAPAPTRPAQPDSSVQDARSGANLTVAVSTYNLPTITYGEPMPPAPTALRAFDGAIPRFESVSVAATVGGRAVNKQIVVLNGKAGIEGAPIRDDAKRLLAMHVGKLNLNESNVYFFDPEVAAQWLATHPVPEDMQPREDDHDDGGSGCGIQNLGNCAEDPGGALQDAANATAAEFERARERAEDWWEDSTDELADAWNEAQDCFSDRILPGGTVPVRFDITPTMTVSLAQGSSRGGTSTSISGSVGLGIPMRSDLQAKVDFFYIPCLPFVVRPRSITVAGDLAVGERLAIEATAAGSFNKVYTIPPTGGPRIPIQVIPIVIGGVPVAVIDVSAYIEGEVEVAASGSVTGSFTLSNEHTSRFDFTCSGQGCRSGSGREPTSSTPLTTTETVQVEGEVTAKPGLYTALMLTLNGNMLSARLGPQPYLEGAANGCGAATATQTNGGNSTGAQNAVLTADLDWGVDFRAEALVAGKIVGNSYRREITSDNHVWFRDLLPGGSSALRVELVGPTAAATGQPTAYRLKMPSCYPYDEDTRYRVTFTGNATPTAVPASACDWQAGRGDCRFDPLRELELRFAWPAEGNYSLTAAVLGDEHRTFDPAPAPTELAVAVTGAPGAAGSSGGAVSGSDRATRSGAPVPTTSSAPAPTTSGAPNSRTSSAPAAGGACCDIVPNPAMRGRLGRIVVAYPEEVSARIDVYRPGETQSVASDYGNAAFDLFPGTYDVVISGKRVTGVTVRSGNDTRIKVGVLRVTASDGTRVDLVDAGGERLTGDYGTDAYGLPIGAVGVTVAGQTETVVVEEGRVTEF